MKKSNLLIVVMIISSFILGLQADLSVSVIAIEIDFVKHFSFAMGGEFIYYLQGIALILSHLGTISLYWWFKDNNRLKTSYLLLIIFPLIFLISFASISLVAFYYYTTIFLTFIPFIITWVMLIIKTHKKLGKVA